MRPRLHIGVTPINSDDHEEVVTLANFHPFPSSRHMIESHFVFTPLDPQLCAAFQLLVGVLSNLIFQELNSSA